MIIHGMKWEVIWQLQDLKFIQELRTELAIATKLVLKDLK